VVRSLWPAVAMAALSALAACSKTEPSKSAEQEKADKAASEKMVRDNPVYGEQVKALDKAKETQKALDEAAAANAKKIDEITK
jgi:mRNA-degrading endonuclease toxin of MazEF toxin-antitoxin module